jgi:hypothetical protein
MCQAALGISWEDHNGLILNNKKSARECLVLSSVQRPRRPPTAVLDRHRGISHNCKILGQVLDSSRNNMLRKSNNNNKPMF